MATRFRIVQILLLAAVLGGFAWMLIGSRPGEPAYQGKALSFWVEQYTTNRWPTDKQAAGAIQHIGSNAIPILLEMLTTRESSFRMKLLARLPKQWLARVHLGLDDYKRKVDQRRTLGAYGFAALGEEARPAVPALISLLNDKNDRVRYLSVFTLRCLGPVAADALPSLIICLNDPEFTVRDDAVEALGTIHEQPERVVPILVEFLQKYRTDPILCDDAIGSLSRFGTQAKPAVPILMEFLKDKETSVRSQATNALMQINPEVLRAMPK